MLIYISRKGVKYMTSLVDQRLKSEIRAYSKRYESELRRTGVSEKEIREKLNLWVEDTYNSYKKQGADLSKLVAHFVFLNQTTAKTQNEKAGKQLVYKR